MSIPGLPPTVVRVRLSIASGSGVGQHVELHRSVTFIGKRPGCKVALHHPHVFSVHAAIVHTGQEVYVRDLTGKEATYHNDLKAVCERLTSGDVIRVGAWELRVDLSPPTQAGAAASARSDAAPASLIAAAERLDDGKVFKFNRPVTLLGRRATCDIVLPDREVSRAHALVFNYLGRTAICDALSKNGLAVNGRSASSALLSAGDTVTIGPFRLAMRTSASKAPAPAAEAASKPSAPAGALDDDVVLRLLMDSKADRIDIGAIENE